MIKFSSLLLLTIPILFAFTGGDLESGTRKSLPSGCFLRSSIATKSVSLLQTKCQFTFTTSYGDIIKDSIRYSHNGINGILRPDTKGVATVILPYGTTRFQFLYTTDYYEIYSDTINLKGGHVAKFDVIFDDASGEVICDKPVIYFYPDVTTDVSVRLKVQGQIGFTYPAVNAYVTFNSKETGWDFTADTNGTIHIGEKEYEYLFWDAKVPQAQFSNTVGSGFFVKRDSLVPFFERNLTEMGLNAREQQDFITYWCPLMQKNETSFIHFMFTEEYDSIATINITPKPDHLFRVFMVWRDADAMNIGGLIVPQEIPAVTREGFTVIEWGGGEIPTVGSRAVGQSAVKDEK
jgi:hypothetical protein